MDTKSCKYPSTPAQRAPAVLQGQRQRDQDPSQAEHQRSGETEQDKRQRWAGQASPPPPVYPPGTHVSEPGPSSAHSVLKFNFCFSAGPPACLSPSISLPLSLSLLWFPLFLFSCLSVSESLPSSSSLHLNLFISFLLFLQPPSFLHVPPAPILFSLHLQPGWSVPCSTAPFSLPLSAWGLSPALFHLPGSPYFTSFRPRVLILTLSSSLPHSCLPVDRSPPFSPAFPRS